MIGLGETMVDAVALADAIERVAAQQTAQANETAQESCKSRTSSARNRP
jgi:ribulose-5-phosphate 4-epimerase/fuculose-1-phosphate aldolase